MQKLTALASSSDQNSPNAQNANLSNIQNDLIGQNSEHHSFPKLKAT